jgi:glycosyltransferase involved in cell wall biosynthesis
VDWLHASSLFVLPSYSEGFPMVVLEAMAAGLPVVATRVGAIPDMVEDNVNGFVVDVKSVNQLIEKIDFLLCHPETGTKMGLANQEKVEAHYSISQVSALFDEFYQFLLK